MLVRGSLEGRPDAGLFGFIRDLLINQAAEGMSPVGNGEICKLSLGARWMNNLRRAEN